MIVVTELIKEGFDVHLLLPSAYLSETKTRHVFILQVALLRPKVGTVVLRLEAGVTLDLERARVADPH
jgi:hypothetical protein